MPPVKNIITTAPPAFPAICLLRQPGLDGADPRTPLLPASHHPPASSQSLPSNHLSRPSLRDQPAPGLTLTPPYWTSTGTQGRQNDPTEVEAPSTPSTCTCGLPHLPPSGLLSPL